jgi:hypothetical protein
MPFSELGPRSRPVVRRKNSENGIVSPIDRFSRACIEKTGFELKSHLIFDRQEEAL